MVHMRAVLFGALAVSLVVLEALALSGRGPAASMSVLSVFALFGFSSLGVQYVAAASMRTRPRLVALAIIGIMAGLASLLLAIDAAPVRLLAQAGLLGAGLTGLAGYAHAAGSASGIAWRAALVELCDAAIVPLAVMQVPFFLWATTGINPVVDARVLAFEVLLGVDLSAAAHRLFEAIPVVDLAAMACYYALPLGLAIAAQQQPSADARTRVLLLAIGTGMVGFALYTVSPVVGIFPAYGAVPPAANSVDAIPMTILAQVPRNGMPSLHTAWAIVIALSALRLSGLWRPALTVFALLNLWAATGAVGHWIMDIVVGVPLAAGVYIAVTPGRRRARRWTGAIGCLALTILWTAGFRNGVPLAGAPAWVAWSAVALTVAGPLLITPAAARQADR